MINDSLNTITLLLNKIRPDVDFNSEKSIITDGIIDSLDLINFIDCIEHEFGITVNFNNITKEDFNSVENIWKMIEHMRSIGRSSTL